MVKKLSAFILTFCLLMALSACGKGSEGDLAQVGDKVISRADFEAIYALYRALPKKGDRGGEEDPEALASDLLDSLVWEKMVEEDARTQGIDESRLFEEKKREAVKSFGNEEGLKSQLKSLKISPEAFEDSLRREAMTLAHREAVAKKGTPSEEDIRTYYDKHPKDRILLDLQEVWVPTRKEAESIAESWNEGKDLDAYQSLNEDPFEKTGFETFKNMGIRDDRLVSLKVFDQNPETAAVYPRDGLYYVVYVRQRQDDYNLVKPYILSLYEEDHYRAYMEKLAKDLHVRIHYDALPDLSPEAQASEEDQSGQK